MHIKKPWFLCKNTLAGVGLGLLAASLVFHYRGETTLLATLQVGLVGFFFFAYGSRHKKYHSGYVNHRSHGKHSH